MLTPLEKQLQLEIETLKRQMARVFRALELRDEDIQRMAMDDALDYMAETQDPALIKKALVEMNSGKGAAA